MNWIKISDRKPEFPCLMRKRSGSKSGWAISPVLIDQGDVNDSLAMGYNEWESFTPPEPELSEGMRALAVSIKRDNPVATCSESLTIAYVTGWRAALQWASERVKQFCNGLHYSSDRDKVHEAAELIKP